MNQVVIFIGVLTEYQGIDLLLEAIPLVVREAPGVKFLIIGYPNENLYREKAKGLGVEKWVYFTGKITHEELPRYLSLADVAISPKISTTEANLKLFSYMAMGLPTVVFDNPVNREILGNLGVYAILGDVKSLAESLVGILRDRSRARELGDQGRRKAATDYSWRAVAQRLTNIYNSVDRLNRSQSGNSNKEDSNGRSEGPGHRRSRFHGLPFNKRAN
jgi:glycosyltransferase involved in cell wall biosynthesis